MGRFVYQPVPSEMEEYSKHGQIIADIYNGHISVNHNNVIVSATKRIENKLEDVFQIENNITEQTNVINNLNEDYYTLIDNQFLSMLNDFNSIKIDVVIQNGTITHLKKGIGDKDSDEPSILKKLVDSIYNMLNIYENSSISHKEKITSTISIISTTTENLKEFNFSSNKKCNLNEFIELTTREFTDQRATINIVKNNLLGKIG